VEPQVFDLLCLLLHHADRVVTRDEIIAEVWGGRIVSDSAISARIAAARKAVGDDGKHQAVIRTVARRGLQWVAPLVLEATSAAADPAPPFPPEEQRIRYTLTANGQSIAYAVTGTGSPLFHLGHPNSHLEGDWRSPTERTGFDRFSAHHRLLRYDAVGFGMSDRRLDTIDFDVYAEDALRVADAAGFDRFAISSESGGVHIALRMAARYPDRIARAVIAGGYVEGRNQRSAQTPPQTFHHLIAEGWETADVFSAAFLLPYFPEGPLEAVQDLAANVRLSASSETMVRLRDALDSISNLALLPQVRCPTLIVHARHDSVHPLTEAMKLASGIPDSELLVLESANHCPLPGNPHYDRYMTSVLAFLAQG